MTAASGANFSLKPPKDHFTIDVRQEGEIPILTVKGYFSQETGDKAMEVVDGLLDQGRRNFVMDFSDCSLVNSPGTVMVLKIAMKVVEDHKGIFVICCVDELKFTVFDMAGVFPLAEKRDSLPEALSAARSK